MEEPSDVKRKIAPSIPANYVSILQLRERWIKEKELKRKEQEEKDEERRRKHHAEEEQHIIEEDPKKPREDLDEMRLDQKHWGRNSTKDESTDGGEARWCEKAETAAIRSESGEEEGLREKKRGRRKRYDRKKRTDQEAGVVEECGTIKPPEYTVKENNTPVKDQIRVYRKKEEKAMGNKSVVKAVTAIETQFEHLSIKRDQETKNLKEQMRSCNPNQRQNETATMVWVKKVKNERAGDGNGSGVKQLHAYVLET